MTGDRKRGIRESIILEQLQAYLVKEFAVKAEGTSGRRNANKCYMGKKLCLIG
jgi:hypothetical protein